MKIGIIIKNYAVGEVFDKSGMPNKCGAEFHAENHGRLFVENGNQVYIMTKKSHLLTKGRETLNGRHVVAPACTFPLAGKHPAPVFHS